MFCRYFKVLLFWRKRFLHSESPTCVACTRSRGGCSAEDVAQSAIHFPIQHLVVYPLQIQKDGEVSFFFPPSFCCPVRLLGIGSLGEAKERKTEQGFCSYANAAFQVSEPGCACCSAFSLFSVLTPAFLFTFEGKNAFLSKYLLLDIQL